MKHGTSRSCSACKSSNLFRSSASIMKSMQMHWNCPALNFPFRIGQHFSLQSLLRKRLSYARSQARTFENVSTLLAYFFQPHTTAITMRDRIKRSMKTVEGEGYRKTNNKKKRESMDRRNLAVFAGMDMARTSSIRSFQVPS